MLSVNQSGNMEERKKEQFSLWRLIYAWVCTFYGNDLNAIFAKKGGEGGLLSEGIMYQVSKKKTTSRSVPNSVDTQEAISNTEPGVG